MANYETNMYNRLHQQPHLVEKYEHPGIYYISVNGLLVYIGKSHNMLWRVAEHYVGIKLQKEHKYRLMAEAQRRGYTVSFGVLYYAKSKWKKDITEEIGKAEGEFIRKYKPLLNTQIPREANWQKYAVNRDASKMTADEFIKAIS